MKIDFFLIFLIKKIESWTKYIWGKGWKKLNGYTKLDTTLWKIDKDFEIEIYPRNK